MADGDPQYRERRSRWPMHYTFSFGLVCIVFIVLDDAVRVGYGIEWLLYWIYEQGIVASSRLHLLMPVCNCTVTVRLLCECSSLNLTGVSLCSEGRGGAQGGCIAMVCSMGLFVARSKFEIILGGRVALRVNIS